MTPVLQALLARAERTWTRWTGWIARRNGALARRARWPIEALAPYRRRQLHMARRGALGDVLMCTPALRELHRLNPACRITFFTDFPEFVRGLPGIEATRPYSERSSRALELQYESSIPPRRHIAEIIGDCIGVRVRNVKPVCVADPDLVEKWQAEIGRLPKPIVAVNRTAGPFTPNKDWPDSHWNELLELLLRSCSIVEIGTTPIQPSILVSENYRDLRGQTTIPDLIAVLSRCDLHVGPMSGPVHIAAGLGKRSVVIYGGYEHPMCSRYAGNVNLFTQLPCSPCWLKDHCPYDRKCLRQILPAEVAEHVTQTATRSN
jgi:ADP-heptose:LPS heptosyltransferase